jgi:UDPglucose 6-dehydrogenase
MEQKRSPVIAIFGAGYVGLSLAVLLARRHEVRLIEIVRSKVDLINSGASPIKDPDIERFLKEGGLRLRATEDADEALKGADVVIIATPTNYDPDAHYFDTSSVDGCVEKVAKARPEALIVIKSTIPVGYVEGIRKKTGSGRVIFSPEFLREGRALYDNLHPARIVVGDRGEKGKAFAALLSDAAEEKDVPVLLTDPTEAEAIKLFANTYLAMRVAFFNELDSYAMVHGLDARSIIDGVCLDPRIGGHYNNPSFGYGGYCLPKDSKQLMANFRDVPNDLISAIVASNRTRKNFLADRILEKKPRTAGVYRLIMKTGSDNFREAAVFGIIERLKEAGVRILVYEPTVRDAQWQGLEIVNDLAEFKRRCDVILANRRSAELSDAADKVFTRDLFGVN